MTLGKNGKEFVVWIIAFLLNVSIWIIYFATPGIIETSVSGDFRNSKIVDPTANMLLLLNVVWVVGIVVIRILAPSMNGRD